MAQPSPAAVNPNSGKVIRGIGRAAWELKIWESDWHLRAARRRMEGFLPLNSGSGYHGSINRHYHLF
jgi:hypothetical protein